MSGGNKRVTSTCIDKPENNLDFSLPIYEKSIDTPELLEMLRKSRLSSNLPLPPPIPTEK
ncbi:hypothetical protein AMATHDRAFT_64141 [Amanita thiersii Skay4041]|uniref:Uncharacterized protein n=1 Tax=Amanita thiersii Skay4041 TaxID=703135 RepID=A0A2A9NFV6_9AGAR|nr:hypothetical protein AMATHDRAFT_64141 [Amanita thiersii Skay4041]